MAELLLLVLLLGQPVYEWMYLPVFLSVTANCSYTAGYIATLMDCRCPLFFQLDADYTSPVSFLVSAVEGFIGYFSWNLLGSEQSKFQTFGLLLQLVETCFWNHVICLPLHPYGFHFHSKSDTGMSGISVLFLDLMPVLFSFILLFYFFKAWLSEPYPEPKPNRSSS